MKKVLSLLLLAGLLALTSLLSVAIAEGYSCVAENDEYALYAEPTTGCFYVQHLASDMQWWSNPPLRDEDKIAKGMQKMDLNSVLLLRLFDIPVRNETLANNYTGSVRQNEAIFMQIPNGFRMEFTLSSYKMMVPMEVLLEGDHVEVSVLVDQVVEDNPDALLAGVSIAPFFHAAGSDENGYMLVPDGSGALIYLNNKKQTLGEYKQIVYGRDLATNMLFSGNVEQPANLPVFGMNKESSGYLAVITEGEAYATVNARVSGAKSTYNTVFADFALRSSDDYEIGAQNEIRMFDEAKPAVEKISVRYYFLPGGACDYNAMARQYRNHLISENGVIPQQSDISLLLECYGAVRKQQSMLGFPYMKTVVLTRYADALNMLDEARMAGVEGLALVFQEMTDASISGVYQSDFSPSQVLGNGRDLQTLMRYCRENEILFAPAMETLSFSKNSLQVNTFATASKTLPQQVATQYAYRLGNGRVNYDRTPSYLLSPTQLPRMTDKLVSALEVTQLEAIALTDLARLLYTDFSRPRTAMSQTQEYVVQSIQTLKEAIPSLIFATPNAYALPYAAMIYDMPQTSSMYDLCDVSVPFYQLCLNGVIPYASTAININSNPRNAFLLAIENGSILKYTLIEEDASILMETELDSLLGVSRADWMELMIASVLEWQALREKTGGLIESHEIVTQDVRKIAYENGTVVYVNFGAAGYPLTTDQIVPACGYLLIEEEVR